MSLDLGSILRTAREKSGLSQSQLAERMGVHRSAVSRWERSAHGITIDNLQAYAAAVDADLAVLLTPKGGPTRKDPHAVADALPPRTRESWLLLGEAMAGLSPSDVRFLLDLAGRLSLESTPERPELGHA